MKSRFLTLIACGFPIFVGVAAEQPALKESFKSQFLIGAALNESWYAGNNVSQAGLVKGQFNSITAENTMKWEAIEPRPGEFRFDMADRFVDFGTKNGMFIVGHTLVWHSQTPEWVFKNAQGNPVDRDTLLGTMRRHINTVVGRYKGRVKGWDVVNEVLAENGSLRDSPWRRIIGDDYIIKAFQYAHEADPGAELYYNDYGIEGGAKRNGAIALVKKLQAAGVPITAVGIQDHVNLKWPTTQLLDDSIEAFGKLGIKVMITELDVDVLPSRSQSISADVNRREAADPALNPYTGGLPDSVQQQLAKRYADLFAVYLKHRDTVSRVTFWGVTDGDSWLNNFPIRGRTAYPLLFDRAGQPKPAYEAVLGQAKSLSASSRNDLKAHSTAARE